ncbi:MAG: dUTP diphosphatase [Bacteroidota bacterium]|nr:dUTP diphosphatase [Candidatus Kapabacteria bacterium]MCX7937672.1 dUTP diphosphatase [Chlorobiota bacterium]MDW8075806.1 dUTP diphosphatase [Bacteroidota bacterium]MDW8272247.1 dUTP diphosphatase [Bacteroidota bacterium]
MKIDLPSPIPVLIQRTDERFADLPLPMYATEGAAGMDLYAAIESPLVLSPGAVTLVPTAIAIALPPGYEAQVRSRSGLALRHGVFCLNSPGTIDSDYRGEIKVILANFGPAHFLIERGMRIAQLVIARYERVVWKQVPVLPSSLRGEQGFGSTGS